MHMADALLSTPIGGIGWATSAGLLAWSATRLAREGEGAERRVPLMGVLGAFVFTAQMINFSIPGTGSSGHIAGSLLLTVLLGPPAAFVAMTAILTTQALFFADGGLLALGCNILNLGFFTCFVSYPLIYRPLAGNGTSTKRVFWATVLAAMVGLQMGAFAVVLETTASGITELPFSAFMLLMQPIHLAIGMVEGLATAGLILYVRRERPELLGERDRVSTISPMRLLAIFAVLTIATGGVLSWFASTYPDGLEWSSKRVSGKEELEAPQQGLHAVLAHTQNKAAFLPDYNFSQPEESAAAGKTGESWPAVSAGTSVSGLVGAGIVLVLLLGLGWILRRQTVRNSPGG